MGVDETGDQIVHAANDAKEPIRVDLDQVFALSLPGNPTTGHTWAVDVDPDFLQIIEQTFAPAAASATAGPAVGASGREIVRLQTLQRGQTQITCSYQRPWSHEVRETKRFVVVID